MIAEIPKKWDYETDVLIVGGGTAGLPAAIVVAETGLKATVLEARGVCGGSFSMVAGGLAIAGTEEQKEAGIEDSADLLYEDMVNICQADPEVARAFADNQIKAYRILKEEGIKWPGLNENPGHSRIRSFIISGLGKTMAQALENRARRVGAEILFRHRAKRLVRDPETQRILGLVVDVENGEKYFKAKKAVILATGGFGRNPEMVAEYAPEMVKCIPMMPPSHIGDGLKMGLDAGAATKDIGKAVAPAWPICIETHQNNVWAINWGGILVNVHGERFHDESQAEGFYGPMTGVGMKQPGGVYWAVFNEQIINDIRAANPIKVRSVEKSKKYQADTIEELASSAGIDVEGLKKTVTKYDSDVESKKYDTVFGRKYQCGVARPLIKITNPPLYAVKCVTATTSMKGGLKINGKCQVLTNYGEVIPGLYAAGEVSGGLHTRTYLLAIMTSSALTLGIIAGQSVVNLEK